MSIKTVTLSNGDTVLISEEDYDAVSQFNWHASGNRHHRYAIRHLKIKGRKTTQSMHKFITGFNRVDHKDGDGYNNTRANLRECTPRQNVQNIRVVSGKSKYKGVAPAKGKWKATIQFDWKKKHLGYFESEEDAAKAYNGAAKELFGEFAVLNEV